MLTPEEENEAEVRREDQENINKFARLNAKLHEVKDEKTSLQVRTVLWRIVNCQPSTCSDFDVAFCLKHRGSDEQR